MKMLRFTTAAVLAAALLASCEQTATTTTNTETATVAGDCPVLADRNWRAWVDHLPGPDAPSHGTLHVTGQVDFPTTGYTWTLTRNMADDVAGATARLDLNWVAPAVGGGAVTPTDVSYAAPAGPVPYTEVTVLCGRGVLETITDIEDVQ